MIRRLSASFFLLGMAVFVVFQQPIFAYCPHSEQFFVNACGCETIVETSCPHCQEEQPATPCDECAEKIQLDLDDLIWSELTLHPPTESLVFYAGEHLALLNFSPATDCSVASVRPPPPPNGPDLFLLNSVFRI
ncbi:MAG: hypothetical protein ACN4GG_07620 [Akkermansiaceae bacterium]